MCYRNQNVKQIIIIIKSSHTVPLLSTPYRFNTFCEEFIDEIPSRKGVKKAINKGELRLNGEISEGGRWLKENDIITVIDLNLTPPKEYQIKIPIIFEDEHLAVINKPSGISVSGNQFKTVQNALAYNLKESTERDKLNWPLPVHRLDNSTSGLLIIAKTKTARVKLGQDFENKLINKKYHAIVTGDTKQEGFIDTPIENKLSRSNYRKISTSSSLKNKQLTLLELEPKTGRTHQLRIHCSTIGHPILGDKLYGEQGNILKHKGLFLAAISLDFIHPINGLPLKLSIDTPSNFLKRLENEELRFIKYNKL